MCVTFFQIGWSEELNKSQNHFCDVITLELYWPKDLGHPIPESTSTRKKCVADYDKLSLSFHINPIYTKKSWLPPCLPMATLTCHPRVTLPPEPGLQFIAKGKEINTLKRKYWKVDGGVHVLKCEVM